MDPQGLQLAKNAARLAAPYAAGLAAALALLGWIPCLSCFLIPALVLGGSFGIGYFITPRLSGFPAGQTKGTLALYVGLGAGLAATVAIVIGTTIFSLLNLLLGGAIAGLFGSVGDFAVTVGSGVLSIVLTVIGSLLLGLPVALGMAFLGSHLALDRAASGDAARPF